MTQHLTHGGLPDGMTRWRVFGLIESVRSQLGLSKGANAYLKMAFSNTMDEDFGAGRICSFWTSATKIATRTKLVPRQIARVETSLSERGFIVKTAADHIPPAKSPSTTRTGARPSASCANRRNHRKSRQPSGSTHQSQPKEIKLKVQKLLSQSR